MNIVRYCPSVLAILAACVPVCVALLAGCGDKSPTDAESIGLYSPEAAISIADLKDRMKSGADADVRDDTGPSHVPEAQLYNPNAKIQLDIVADGNYGVGEVLEQAKGALGKNKYDVCLAMVGVRDAMQASDPAAALADFTAKYKELLDLLDAQHVPVVVCEILPIVDAYQKPTYKMPAAEINQLIGKMNEAIYALALEQADAIVFASKVLGPMVNTSKNSIILNEANSGRKNGVQPTFEGMRLLCQLFAQGLHKEGYRGERILVLGDTVVANAAMTRKIDAVSFLLPKYLEIELNKTLGAP